MSKSNEKWGSNFGFIMAAVGSAVGLGNIWGFPYKMGVSGGFAFLLIYLILAILIGFVIMFGELLIGRSTGKSVMGAYRQLSKNYTFLGWLGFICPFLILSFYCSLGGYCMKYSIANLGDVFGAGFGVGGMDSGEFFGTFVADPVSSTIFGLIFVAITMLIIMAGVSGGIEKVVTIAMPVLFVLLLIVIVRSVTLPGASEGLAFMFAPNFAPFKENFVGVLSTAGGQMFFSLSLGMGCMITYGSYLEKKENIEKNSIIIILCDTLIAVMAGLAVMPAVFAMGMEPAGGPGLLFVTLQAVFGEMGAAGPIFGFLFYFLVFIAAITSSISLLEVATASVIDMIEAKGKVANRKKITPLLSIIVAVGVTIVSVDALGGGPLPQPMGFIWLDFFDLWSEGIFMPLGALCMSLIIGWKLGPEWIRKEQEQDGHVWKGVGFAMACFKVIAPIGMFFILIGQLNSFFGLGLF